MYKVLIVEDEAMIRKGLAFSFPWLEHGCVVISEAVNGQDGLEKIAEHQPDIVITDVTMPFKDGIAMLRESAGENGYVPIILSGYDEFAYAKAAMNAGAIEYLLKPLEYGQLELALEKAKRQLEMRRHYKRSQEINSGVMGPRLVLPEKPVSWRVGRMIAHVEKNYAAEIHINQLVEALNTSATHLQQKFKEETGYTFLDFTNRYRVQKAIDLLRQGDCKVSEAATASGFRNYKYFSQVFRKYTGTTPSEFIEYFSGKPQH
jgi:two-component system response regulator YesN